MENNSVQGGGQNATNQGSQVPKQGGLSWSQPPTTGNKPLTGTANQNKPAVPITSTQKSGSTPPYIQNTQSKTGNKKLLGIIASGVLLGFLVGWAWYASRPVPTEDEVVVTPGGTTATGGNSIASPANSNTTANGATGASGQAGAVAAITYAPGVSAAAEDFVSVPTPQVPGMRVLVSGLKVSQPTWIVIYDNNNGVRGNALGAALFSPTYPNTAVNVSLLRGTVAGKTYLIGRNVDNGNKIFSLQEDGPVVDTTGKPVYQTLDVRN